MRFFRWVLALGGFIQRGPLFFRIWYAFVGYWIGSVIDNYLYSFFKGKSGMGSERAYGNSSSSQNDLLRALMTVFAHVIHADGRIMHSEMEYVRQFLRVQFNDSQESKGEQMILKIFQQKKSTSVAQWERNVAINCQLLAMYMPSNQRIQLVQVLIQMAKVDGAMAPAEIQALRFIATYLGLGAGLVDQLLGGTYSSSQSYSSFNSLDEAYRTLGISSSASDDEVRKAYRRLALKFHPDKVASQDEAARQSAAMQFSKITEAKDRIYAARGMK